MKLDLEPGVYVLAVSGGVDSMVLLDAAADLKKTSNALRNSYQFVVAHFDHGIREDSELDRLLVEKVTKKHHLPFVYDQARLGPNASEALARKARYNFLQKVRKASGADAIVTAHHQDDLIETAILNLLRGTGRKGLTSLADTADIRRPLMGLSKKQLVAYAKRKNLIWREDSTNSDTKYKRNYVRQHIIPNMNKEERQKIIQLISQTNKHNELIDEQITSFMKFINTKNGLEKKIFINLPHKVALEVMAAWLRNHTIRQFDRQLLNRLVTSAKSLKPGKKTDINDKYFMAINKDSISIIKR